MKNCSWYLWLNGKKIFNIRELRENFDTAVLSGYFLGGSLMKWLSDLGEYSLLKRLSSIDLENDIGTQLEFAFGVSPDKKAAPDTAVKPYNPPAELPVSASEVGLPEMPVFCGSFYSSAGSFMSFSEVLSSFSAASSFMSLTESSFSAYAETMSSFGLNSSYAAFVSGQAVNMIQSSGSSFVKLFTGIFSETAGSAGYWLGGSFSNFLTGSYKGFYAGSFFMSLFGTGSFLSSSGVYGSWLRGLFGDSSFTLDIGGITVTAEEYRRTLINLSSCPLNAYGYGINLV